MNTKEFEQIMNDGKSTTEQSKRVAVILGRFQPPHVGHYSVISSTKKYIKNHPELNLETMPIVVVIQGEKTGLDKQRNPLSPNDRVSFMKSSGHADGVKFFTAKSAMDAFYTIRNAGYEPISVAAGEDRAQTYLDMLNKYFKTSDDNPIKHTLIELPRTGIKKSSDSDLKNILKYVDNNMPIALVSASLARLAVRENDRKKFSILTGLEYKPKLADKLFDKIKSAMGEHDA
jgi:hypothetical protein